MATEVAVVPVQAPEVVSDADRTEEPMETAPEAQATESKAKSPAKRGAKKSAGAAATPKQKRGRKSAGDTADAHPKYSQMIRDAISNLKERNGSSRQAILKYILANYSVQTDERQVNNHLKMSIRAGVKSGKLQQSKGSGACGKCSRVICCKIPYRTVGLA